MAHKFRATGWSKPRPRDRLGAPPAGDHGRCAVTEDRATDTEGGRRTGLVALFASHPRLRYGRDNTFSSCHGGGRDRSDRGGIRTVPTRGGRARAAGRQKDRTAHPIRWDGWSNQRPRERLGAPASGSQGPGARAEDPTTDTEGGRRTGLVALFASLPRLGCGRDNTFSSRCHHLGKNRSRLGGKRPVPTTRGRARAARGQKVWTAHTFRSDGWSNQRPRERLGAPPSGSPGRGARAEDPATDTEVGRRTGLVALFPSLPRLGHGRDNTFGSGHRGGRDRSDGGGRRPVPTRGVRARAAGRQKDRTAHTFSSDRWSHQRPRERLGAPPSGSQGRRALPEDPATETEGGWHTGLVALFPSLPRLGHDRDNTFGSGHGGGTDRSDRGSNRPVPTRGVRARAAGRQKDRTAHTFR
jgi:hypothetical protein